MTFSTFVCLGSRPSSTTRNMTSRSVKMPATLSSFTTTTQPTLAEAISSMASITVIVFAAVKTEPPSTAIVPPLFSISDSIHHCPDAADLFKNYRAGYNRAISSLNHPHICTLFDIGQHEG